MRLRIWQHSHCSMFSSICSRNLMNISAHVCTCERWWRIKAVTFCTVARNNYHLEQRLLTCSVYAPYMAHAVAFAAIRTTKTREHFADSSYTTQLQV